MATLEKIRSKGVFLLIIIGLAMFAFIIGDFLKSGSSYFKQSKEEIADIDGEVVKAGTYMKAIDQLTEVYKIEYNTQSLNEDITEQIRQSVWESLVKEKLLLSELEKVGIGINKKELTDITIGDHIDPIVQGRRAFANPNTGVFDKQVLLNFLSSINEEPKGDEQKKQLEQARSYWMYFENLIKTNRLEQKYQTLLAKGINANSLDAKFSFDTRKTSADILYVVKPYFSIPDASVKVSDDEIKAKYDELKEQFKQETNRDIQTVAFNLQPSQQDFTEVSNWINKLKPEFETTADVVSLVNSNSDVPYKDIPQSFNDVEPDLRGFAFSGTTGQFYGPVLSNGSYKMARIIQGGIMAPDSIKLRHIVIMDESPEKTAILADSVMTALKGGANFAQLALKYSKVTSTATHGGEIGWVKAANLSPEMAQSAFAAGLNQLFTVKESNAIQIMEVMQKTANVKKVKLAVIERQVIPSSRTQSDIYNKAKQFAANNRTLDSFEAAAKKAGYVVTPFLNIGESQSRLNGIKNSRQIIKWAYEGNKGDVSDVKECENQFIVAGISAVNEKGYKSLESVRDELKNKIIVEKKGDIISKEMVAKGASSLPALAQQLNLKIDTLKQVSFAANNLGNIGFEPAIIATAPLAQVNALSAPVKGKMGVFVYTVLNKVNSPEQYNATIEKANLGMRYTYSIPSMLIQVLKDEADIVDKRSNIF